MGVKLASLLLALLVLAGCAGAAPGDGSTSAPATTTPATTTPATTSPATTTPATTTPATTTPATTSPATTTTMTGPPSYAAVVLVEPGDTLTVRRAAGADQPVVSRLEPDARSVVLTGARVEHDGATWVEVDTPDGRGWANDFYLATEVSDAEFSADPAIDDLIDALATAFRNEEDLTPVSSRRGLLIDYHGIWHWFRGEDLATIAASEEVRPWGSTAADLSEIRPLTFAAAVGGRFLGVYLDDDATRVRDEELPGPNGIVPGFIIPSYLRGFHYVALRDPGDNPEWSGLDWYTWYVYVDYEDGEPRVAAMSIDAYAP